MYIPVTEDVIKKSLLNVLENIDYIRFNSAISDGIRNGVSDVWQRYRWFIFSGLCVFFIFIFVFIYLVLKLTMIVCGGNYQNEDDDDDDNDAAR